MVDCYLQIKVREDCQRDKTKARNGLHQRYLQLLSDEHAAILRIWGVSIFSKVGKRAHLPQRQGTPPKKPTPKLLTILPPSEDCRLYWGLLVLKQRLQSSAKRHPDRQPDLSAIVCAADTACTNSCLSLTMLQRTLLLVIMK